MSRDVRRWNQRFAQELKAPAVASGNVGSADARRV
jgi:hypothetical protein